MSVYGDGPGPYPIRHGSDIFCYDSMTGLARSPLDDLASYILGVTAGGPFSIDPERLCYELLSAGSVVVVDPQDEELRRFHKYIYAPSEREWIAYLPDSEGCVTLKCQHHNLDMAYSEGGNIRYKLNGEKWRAEYLDEDGKVKEWPEGLKDYSRDFDTSRIVVIPNGRGLLYWCQKLFWRLEEIAETEKVQMSGPNLAPFLTGDIGAPELLMAAFAKPNPRFIAAPGNVQIDRVVSTAIVDMLLKWYDARRSDWLNALNAIDNEAVDRPVAGDRTLRMMSSLRFANRVRDRMRDFYTDTYSEEIKFDRIITLSGDELTKQITALQMLRPDLGEDWYMEQITLLSRM